MNQSPTAESPEDIEADIELQTSIELGLQHFRHTHIINKKCENCKGEGHLGKVAEGENIGRYEKCGCAMPLPTFLIGKSKQKIKLYMCKQKARFAVAERKRLAEAVNNVG